MGKPNSAQREWLAKLANIGGGGSGLLTVLAQPEVSGELSARDSEGEQLATPGIPLQQRIAALPDQPVFGPATDKQAYEETLRAVDPKVRQILKEPRMPLPPPFNRRSKTSINRCGGSLPTKIIRWPTRWSTNSSRKSKNIRAPVPMPRPKPKRNLKKNVTAL